MLCTLNGFAICLAMRMCWVPMVLCEVNNCGQYTNFDCIGWSKQGGEGITHHLMLFVVISMSGPMSCVLWRQMVYTVAFMPLFNITALK